MEIELENWRKHFFRTYLSFSSDTLLNCRSSSSRTLRRFDMEKEHSIVWEVLRWRKDTHLDLFLFNQYYSPLYRASMSPPSPELYICWIMPLNKEPQWEPNIFSPPLSVGLFLLCPLHKPWNEKVWLSNVLTMVTVANCTKSLLLSFKATNRL